MSSFRHIHQNAPFLQQVFSLPFTSIRSSQNIPSAFLRKTVRRMQDILQGHPGPASLRTGGCDGRQSLTRKTATAFFRNTGYIHQRIHHTLARKSCVTTQKKRETVVTRPTLRGSGMPTVAERATSRAHADMDITSPFATQYTRIEKGCAYIHIPRTSTVASSLTTIEIYQIP